MLLSLPVRLLVITTIISTLEITLAQSENDQATSMEIMPNTSTFIAATINTSSTVKPAVTTAVQTAIKQTKRRTTPPLVHTATPTLFSLTTEVVKYSTTLEPHSPSKTLKPRQLTTSITTGTPPKVEHSPTAETPPKAEHSSTTETPPNVEHSSTTETPPNIEHSSTTETPSNVERSSTTEVPPNVEHSSNTTNKGEEIWWLYVCIPIILLAAVLVTSAAYSIRKRCRSKKKTLSEEEHRLNEDETQL